MTEKALYRAALALYNLKRYSECYESLEMLQSRFPRNRDALAELARARDRLLEQKTGAYNFEQMRIDAGLRRPTDLDYATYIGPVEIKETQSKGRGLFVTKPVKAGDLLLCEKAFGYAAEYSSTYAMLVHSETGQVIVGARAELLRVIVQKLYRNPSTAPAFTTLYHGNYEGVSAEVDTEPIVDT